MSTRQDVSRETARLLYNRSVKEFKDAKEIAAASLRSRALPSNYEVAIELDRLTDKLEGSDRQTMPIEMRAHHPINALRFSGLSLTNLCRISDLHCITDPHTPYQQI